MKITNTQHGMKLTGRIKLELFNDEGLCVQRQFINNLIMNAGKVSVAKLIGGLTGLYARYMAIGTDNTAAAASQTALLAEITTNGGARTSTSNSSVTTSVTNDTIRFVATWAFTGSFSIAEIGLLDASSGGNMFARQVITQSVSSGQTLQATWDIQVS